MGWRNVWRDPGWAAPGVAVAAGLAVSLATGAVQAAPAEGEAQPAKSEQPAKNDTPADAKQPADDKQVGGPWGQPHGGQHWALSVGMGYAAVLGDVYGLEVDPYRVSLGGMASYTFNSGVWLGLYGDVYSGRTVSQIYEPFLTTLVIPIDADTQAASLGLGLGYDMPLGPLVLRYGLGLGVSLLWWDFGDIPYTAVAGYSPMKGTLAGLHLIPSIGLVLPMGHVFTGVDFYSRVETSEQVPAAIGTRLNVGVRF